MNAKKSQDATAQQHSQQQGSSPEPQGSGVGAASALARMKEEHALRQKRQHGERPSTARHEDLESPQS